MVGLLVLAGVGTTGCASTGVHRDPPVTVVLVDCSKSVRGNQTQWPHEISTIAEKVLTEEGRLRVGCFAGTAVGVLWTIDVKGEEVHKVTGGAPAKREYQRVWARQLEGAFRQAAQPRKEAGTDWLNALEAASQTEELAAVYIFSDLIQEDEGIDLTMVQSTSHLEAIAREWARRLGGLHGVTVRVVGAGQGIGAAVDRQGEALFGYLKEDVPFAGRLLATVP